MLDTYTSYLLPFLVGFVHVWALMEPTEAMTLSAESVMSLICSLSFTIYLIYVDDDDMAVGGGGGDNHDDHDDDNGVDDDDLCARRNENN